jgi:hypothetical protein
MSLKLPLVFRLSTNSVYIILRNIFFELIIYSNIKGSFVYNEI